MRVRVRQPKSASEAARYTVSKCALEATLMREPSSTPSSSASAAISNSSGRKVARRQTPISESSTGSWSSDLDSDSRRETALKPRVVVDEATHELSSGDASSNSESGCDTVTVSNRFAVFSLE